MTEFSGHDNESSTGAGFVPMRSHVKADTQYKFMTPPLLYTYFLIHQLLILNYHN